MSLVVHIEDLSYSVAQAGTPGGMYVHQYLAQGHNPCMSGQYKNQLPPAGAWRCGAEIIGLEHNINYMSPISLEPIQLINIVTNTNDNNTVTIITSNTTMGKLKQTFKLLLSTTVTSN